MTKRAFLIGINAYKDSPLSGCVNDVSDMRDYLMLSGFAADNIRTLLDERAGVEQIISRLHWLRAGAQAGDKLVLHFSGHGTTIRRWENNLLALGADACLVPYDFNWKYDHSFITDGDLDDIFCDLPPGVDLTMIFDSCHSGGMRDLPSPGSKRSERLKWAPCGTPSVDGVRYLAPPQDVIWRMAGRDVPRRPLGSWLQPDSTEPYRTLCACQADQTASDSVFDVEDAHGTLRANGAFTWAVLKSLRVGPARTWVQIIEDAKNFLKEDGFFQVPVLSGSPAAMNTYP
jgi:hypothetical protein